MTTRINSTMTLGGTAGRMAVGVFGSLLLTCAAFGQAANIKTVYTEIQTHPSSLVPGAKDALGQPTVARFTALFDFNMRHDGGQWIMRGTSNLPTTVDSILMIGSGLTGTAFLQDGQPVFGGLPGELYDFFDGVTPAAWDDNGNIAYSFRAKGGVASVFEKVYTYNGVTHTKFLQMGDPALGLTDFAPAPSGDEIFGNSIAGIHLLNDGRVGFANSPIGNCSSLRYPAFFRGNTGFIQSGVTTIGAEVWDNVLNADVGGTPDGLHWFAEGDTENPDTSIDAILAVDGTVVMRENTALGATSIIAAETFFTRMLSNGTWFARGDDTADNDWAMRNGVVIAATGDDITTPPQVPDEDWGANFTNFTGNRLGDWIITGNTTNANSSLDTVIVLNGTTVVAREGDAVDLDNNGLADDDAFLNTIRSSAYLTDDLKFYFMATLRDGNGLPLNDAFVMIEIPQPVNCPADIAPAGPPIGDGTVNVQDLLAVIGAWGACVDPNNCPADIAPAPLGDDVVNVQDLLAVIGAWGACP